MSPRIAGVSLLIAVLLGLGAWYVSRPEDASRTQRVALLDLPIGEVTRISFRFGDATVSVARHPVTRDWIMRAGGADQAAWVASESAVRGFLRLLSEDRAEAMPPDPARETGSSSEVVITTPTQERSIRVYVSPLGGRAMATLRDGAGERAGSGTSVWLGPDRVGLFQPASVAAWRDKHLLAGNGGQADQLDVGSGAAHSTVRKSGAGWTVSGAAGSEFSGLRADPRAVSQVLSLLEGAEIEAFPEGVTRATAGLDAPAATVRVLSTFDVTDLMGKGAPGRSPPSDTRLSLVRTITIGGVADAEGRTLYAQVEATFAAEAGTSALLGQMEWTGDGTQCSPVYGPTICTVPRAALEQIAVAPEMYAVRVALANASPADIEAVRISREGASAAFRLTTDGWTSEGGGGGAGQGEGRSLSEAQSAALREIVTFFTDAQAESIRPAAGFAPVEGDRTLVVTLIPRGMRDGVEFTLVSRAPPGARAELFVTAAGRSSTLIYRDERSAAVFREAGKLAE